MHRNGFRNAAQHEPVDATVAVRSNHDQVCTPIFLLLQDDFSGVAYRHKTGFDRFDVRTTKYLVRTGNGFFGLAPRLFLNRLAMWRGCTG
jgi:hypothetical protein